jgi:hypothetical protein
LCAFPNPGLPSQCEARRISTLISRLPELVEFEKDRNRAQDRRKPQPLRSKPVTSETSNPIWARPDARVGGAGHYPDFIRKKPS